MSIYVNMSSSGLGWKKSCVSIMYESIKKQILKLLRLTSSGSIFKTTTVLISVTMKTTELARALHAYSLYPFKTIQQSDRLKTKRKKRGRKKTLEGDCCVGYYHVLSTCLGKVDEYLTEGGWIGSRIAERIWVKETTRISDFEDTFCGVADFDRSADHGFLQYFSVDYGVCLFWNADRGIYKRASEWQACTSSCVRLPRMI